ncbi:MAG TPA: hypothetical protein VGD72_11140 [Mycobacteriales bacterium]
MTFDERAYENTFVRRHRASTTLSDDLLERYAISLPVTEAELAGHLAAVRAYWNRRSASLTAAGQVCKMCRAADEVLVQKHGAHLATARFWENEGSSRRDASAAAIARLAGQLRETYGPLGAVTDGILTQLAGALRLERPQAEAAARQAGLTLVRAVEIPDAPRVPQYGTLTAKLGQASVRSVPALLHPDIGRFSIVDGFAVEGRPGLRLDGAAVDEQTQALDRRGGSVRNNALTDALRIVRSAANAGQDLRDLALYHLVQSVEAAVRLSATAATSMLEELGLTHADAAVLVLSLLDTARSPGATGLSRVTGLLAEGRLNEARQALVAIPSGHADREAAEAEVANAEERLAGLLADAERALARQDEAHAATLLREAVGISADDAGPYLLALPPPPPDEVRVVPDGRKVTVFWRAAPGHDGSTTYAVARREDRDPADARDGAAVYRGTASTCEDTTAPVARRLRYAVFALSAHGVCSRATTAAAISVPPVYDVVTDVGPGEVAVRWSVHGAADHVEVTRRTAGGTAAAVPVSHRSCHLSGLPEGEAVHLGLRAVYLDEDGRPVASPAVGVTATPRSAARPLPGLAVVPVEGADGARVRVSWTPVDHSDVRIRRSGSPPPWQYGAAVGAEAMEAFGTEVGGRRVSRGDGVELETSVPPGVHHFVPFSVGGTGIAVGRAVTLGSTEPVRRLVATPFDTYATLSWEWPPTARLAEVASTVDGRTTRETIGLGEYRAVGGARVQLGRTACTVEVRAVVLAGGQSYVSAPASVRLGGAPPTVRYEVAPASALGRLGGRGRRVTFRADEGCSAVRVRMIAAPGRVMPTTPDAGVVLLDARLDLTPGSSAEHPVVIPRSVKRPYWVRCFVVAGAARLLDPQVASLKEP